MELRYSLRFQPGRTKVQPEVREEVVCADPGTHELSVTRGFPCGAWSAGESGFPYPPGSSTQLTSVEFAPPLAVRTDWCGELHPRLQHNKCVRQDGVRLALLTQIVWGVAS